MTDQHAEIQAIEQLTQRYNELSEARVRAQTNLENAQKQLEKLQAEATEQFGTCDVEELKTKLQQIESENKQLQLDYQNHLTEIENNLKTVEGNYAQAGQPQAAPKTGDASADD